jgi:hypothetical protein
MDYQLVARPVSSAWKVGKPFYAFFYCNNPINRA